MNIKQALENIRQVSPDLAVEEVKCIRENQEEAIPVLLERVKAVIDLDEEDAKEYDEHFYSMLLLAEFRVHEAFVHLLEYLKLDSNFVYDLLGDTLTEYFSVILATLATESDIPHIKEVIENPSLDSIHRSVACEVLIILYATGAITRDEYHSYLEQLLTKFHDDAEFLGFVICNCLDAGFDDLFPLIEKLYKKKLVATELVDLSDVKEKFSGNNEESALVSLKKDKRFTFITNALDTMSRFAYFAVKSNGDNIGNMSLSEIIDKGISALSNREQIYFQNFAIAERSEPKYHLSDALSDRSVSILKNMAKLYNISGSSKMKKKYLIEHMADLIVNTDVLEMRLNELDEEEWEIFTRVAREGSLINELEHLDYVTYLFAHGLLFVYLHEGDFYYVVPEEVRSAFQELECKGFSDNKNHSLLLNSYAIATTNLYGVLLKSDFVDIFNKQNERKIVESEMIEILSEFIDEEEDYAFDGDYLVAFQLDGWESAELKGLAEGAASHPRYIPDKEELLKYVDIGYIEETPEVRKLRLFIQEVILNEDDVEDDEINDLLMKIYFSTRALCDKDVYIDILDDEGIVLSKAKFKTFMSLIDDLAVSVRIYLCNGHTVNEILEMEHGSRSEPVRVVKVGRNEPCPCGSGKKYKKCCGM